MLNDSLLHFEETISSMSKDELVNLLNRIVSNMTIFDENMPQKVELIRQELQKRGENN